MTFEEKSVKRTKFIIIFCYQVERQELRPCIEILSDVLTFLHLRLRDDNDETRDVSSCDVSSRDVINRDVGVVADYLLHSLIQTILLMDRQTKSAIVVRRSYLKTLLNFTMCIFLFF
jgi:hypothetical protein